ncbi:two-component system regulatory protein YycI [Salinicoccus albus]|uniref:two-component system regulatory protein YycI n=1 Tax=Salinicoccus albus TaxID=418756 RepID=UPI00037A9B25|nr:two-component system regulatory protein YycI [Salinicoccus albus]
MDWKLTKSLYILVFLLMNIALVLMLYNKQQEGVREIESTPNTLEQTNIDVSNVPSNFEPVEMNILTGEAADFTNLEEVEAEDVESTEKGAILSENLEGSDSELSMDASMLSNFKDENLYRGDEYQYDDVMSSDNRILFTQYFENYPIFSNEAAHISFSGEGNEVSAYQQGYISNLRENSYSDPTAVRDPMNCVADLYQRDRISEDAVVENARLGYYVILNDGEQIMLRPKWEFIITENDVEKTIYIDAISETEDIIESE